MKKYLIFIIILLGIGGTIFFLWRQSFYLDWRLRFLELSMKASDFRVIEYDEFVFKERKNIEILAKKEDNIIRFKIIKDIDKETADKYIDDIFYKLEAHFEPKDILGIYADVINAVAKVPEELKPKREIITINNKETPCFIAFSDKYFSYFVITKEQAVYQGTIAMFYCPQNKNLVNIELLMPKEKFNFEKLVDILKTFKCE